MPITLLPIILGGLGGLGGLIVKKHQDNVKTGDEITDINTKAKSICENAQNALEAAREATRKSLENFGRKKLDCCQHTLKNFIDLFQQVISLDLASPEADELSEFNIDEQSVWKLEELSIFATSAGTETSAENLVAFGIHGAGALTEMDDRHLQGDVVIIANPTLAFFGGNALTKRELAEGSGVTLLGKSVAGPSLFFLRDLFGTKSMKKLEDAYSNLEKAIKTERELNELTSACKAIKDRCDLFINLLIRVDMRMMKQYSTLESIIRKEGRDWQDYSEASKQAIIGLLALAKAYNALLTIPLLDKNGKLQKNTLLVAQAVQKQLAQ